MSLQFVLTEVKRHFIIVVLGLVVVIVAFVLLSELNSRKEEPLSPSASLTEDTTFVPTAIIQASQSQRPPAPPRKEEQPTPQLSRPLRETPKDTVTDDQKDTRGEQRKTEIAKLQQELSSLAQEIAQVRTEDEEQKAWRNEQLQMLENHAREIVNLGSSLQQVFKTPRQIRITATNLQQQAKILQSQAQSAAQPVGTSAAQQKIRAEKQSTLEDMASDLDDIALKLQRTQGDPSRVKVIAIEIQRKGGELQRTIETNRRQKTPPNTQLISLEKKHESLNNKILELQRQQVAENL